MRGATPTRQLSTNASKFQPTRPLRGATTGQSSTPQSTKKFQPTRPLRGATLTTLIQQDILIFQPTRPLRGATSPEDLQDAITNISTHAPLAGRDHGYHTTDNSSCDFNPRAPCGARLDTLLLFVLQNYFNPRAPCGARQAGLVHRLRAFDISTHAPLAGRYVEYGTE